MKNHPEMPAVAQVRAFLRLSRLKFLIGGLFSFALGAAVAKFDGFAIGWPAYVHGQVMVSAFHLMAHYANDYFDRFCDATTERTPWSGGSGALLDGGLAPSVALIAACACAAIGALAIVTFAASGAIVPAVAGTIIALLAWVYSAPPPRLLARGWGELDTSLIIGLLFPLAGYATFAHALTLRIFASALPSVAAMFVLMLCVEFPDVESDRATGKMNLVARLGRRRGRFLVYAAVAAVYAGAVIAVLLGGAPSLAYFVALTIPLAWMLCARLGVPEAPNAAQMADVAANGVALFVATILGSTLAYVAAML